MTLDEAVYLNYATKTAQAITSPTQIGKIISGARNLRPDYGRVSQNTLKAEKLVEKAVPKSQAQIETMVNRYGKNNTIIGEPIPKSQRLPNEAPKNIEVPGQASGSATASKSTAAAEDGEEGFNWGRAALIGGATGLGGYGAYKLMQPTEKVSNLLQQVTYDAFNDELAKLAFFGRKPQPINVIIQNPNGAAVETLARGGKLGINPRTLGLVGLGGTGALLGANAYKDWQAGRQMRTQMGG